MKVNLSGQRERLLSSPLQWYRFPSPLLSSHLSSCPLLWLLLTSPGLNSSPLLCTQLFYFPSALLLSSSLSSPSHFLGSPLPLPLLPGSLPYGDFFPSVFPRLSSLSHSRNYSVSNTHITFNFPHFLNTSESNEMEVKYSVLHWLAVPTAIKLLLKNGTWRNHTQEGILLQ